MDKRMRLFPMVGVHSLSLIAIRISMKHEERLIEVMAELLAEVHEMRVDTKKQLDALADRVGQVEGQLTKVNLQLGENTRAIIKLAEKVEVVPNLVERVVRLETEVFRKAG